MDLTDQKADLTTNLHLSFMKLVYMHGHEFLFNLYSMDFANGSCKKAAFMCKNLNVFPFLVLSTYMSQTT